MTAKTVIDFLEQEIILKFRCFNSLVLVQHCVRREKNTDLDLSSVPGTHIRLQAYPSSPRRLFNR